MAATLGSARPRGLGNRSVTVTAHTASYYYNDVLMIHVGLPKVWKNRDVEQGLVFTQKIYPFQVTVLFLRARNVD